MARVLALAEWKSLRSVPEALVFEGDRDKHLGKMGGPAEAGRTHPRGTKLVLCDSPAEMTGPSSQLCSPHKSE